MKAFELGIDGVATFTVDPAVHSLAGLTDYTGLRLLASTGPVTSPTLPPAAGGRLDAVGVLNH